MLAAPMPCSSNTSAAASNSFSRVSSRVGRVRTLDMTWILAHCNSIQYRIEWQKRGFHEHAQPGRPVLRRSDVARLPRGPLSPLRALPRSRAAAARDRGSARSGDRGPRGRRATSLRRRTGRPGWACSWKPRFCHSIRYCIELQCARIHVMSRVRTRPTRDETREKLFEAAAEVFEEHGIGAASIEMIAAAAGLTRGAFYSNFDGKDDLSTALLADHGARSLKHHRDLLARHRDPARFVAAP